MVSKLTTPVSNGKSQNEIIEDKKKQLQDTSKWVLSAFAAIAGLMLTGLKFSDIGKLQSPYIFFASATFIIAMAAVFIEIFLVTRVLTFGGMNEEKIRKFAKDKNNPSGINLNDTLLLDGYTKVDDFLDDYKKYGEMYEKALKDNKKEEASKLTDRVSRLVKTFNNFRIMAGYVMLKTIYFSAIRGLFIFGAIAAIGIAIFVWSISKTPLTNYIYMNPPGEATVALTTAGQTALRDALGKDCVSRPDVSVIVLSIDGGVFDVVSIPTDTCNVARFTVDSDTGLVTNRP